MKAKSHANRREATAELHNVKKGVSVFIKLDRHDCVILDIYRNKNDAKGIHRELTPEVNYDD